MAATAGIVAGALTMPTAALAADSKAYIYRVELAETTRKAQVRAGNVKWECRGKHCVASAHGGSVSVRGCRELAGQVGRVVSYRSEIKALGAEQIDVCNAALADAGSRSRAPEAAANAPAKRDAPTRVTTEELTFTGVHSWSPAR
jgi:hypothetical protein